ncbi:MAG: hypothetical protein ACF8Q5_14965 [Phycisphaerales bacterium JB040]
MGPAVIAIGVGFLALLLVRVAFLLVLRSGETRPRTKAGTGPRVIKNLTPTSQTGTNNHDHPRADHD